MVCKLIYYKKIDIGITKNLITIENNLQTK